MRPGNGNCRVEKDLVIGVGADWEVWYVNGEGAEVGGNLRLSYDITYCKSHVNLVVCGLFYFYGILYCDFSCN